MYWIPSQKIIIRYFGSLIFIFSRISMKYTYWCFNLSPRRFNYEQTNVKIHRWNWTTTIITYKMMQCWLQHFWSQCFIEDGDIISIMGIWNAKFQSYCVANADDLVVVRPDSLVLVVCAMCIVFVYEKSHTQAFQRHRIWH